MVGITSTSLFAASVALLASSVNAYGQIAQVVDANNFCVFLPPSDSVDRGIADTEWNAEAFCMGKAPLAKKAGTLDSGFIQSAHFLATDEYVQVTGQINPAKARLNVTDEGGQYDIKAPKGSSCAGWKYFVNLVEPAGNTYCMRCCNDDRNCNRGISEKGCAHIIPGDYSGPYDNGGAPREYGKPGGGKDTKATSKKGSTKTKTSTKSKKTKSPKKTSTSSDASAKPTTTSADAVPTTNAPAADPSAVPSADDSAVPSAGASAVPSAGPSAVPSADDSAVPSAGASASDSDASSPIAAKNNEMLSQNDEVTEQSVNGAGQSQPTLMALAGGLVTMAMMMMTQ